MHIHIYIYIYTYICTIIRIMIEIIMIGMITNSMGDRQFGPFHILCSMRDCGASVKGPNSVSGSLILYVESVNLRVSESSLWLVCPTTFDPFRPIP